MDITLSEAPNLLSNRPVLTPALISAQAFFLSGIRQREGGEKGYRPAGGDSQPGYC
jgi:hypothetical protein